MTDDREDLAAQIAAVKAQLVRQQHAEALLERLGRVGGAEGGVDAATARAMVEEFGIDPDELSGDDGPSLIAALLRELGLEPDAVDRFETILRESAGEEGVDLDDDSEED